MLAGRQFDLLAQDLNELGRRLVYFLDATSVLSQCGGCANSEHGGGGGDK
ncbi:hypothetical protein C882_1036 [Caenispirillum salinarum AK4]|uniref:Uncharacterized protein n=1 Tax=Caenispirillum salinarum AK4 TaxID=1238182 RepID=K9GPZ3_9PROT|nr:hypothetical protein C882_1036 [Caenispirillum salinarum AK4]